MKKKIGIIGFGNMGSAIAESIKSAYEVIVFDKDTTKTKAKSGIDVVGNAQDLTKKSDCIILAVKPRDFECLLREIKDSVKGKLVISIAAGIGTQDIENTLGEIKVIRVMPNLPAKIKKAMSWLCKGRFADEEDLESALALFKNVGEVLTIDEKIMNTATALSGSGPGFLCDLIEGKTLEEIKDFAKRSFIPALTVTATNFGFSVSEAKILAESTADGTVEYLEKEHLSPETVKKQVASEGGTTEAGLKVLQHDIANLTMAVEAAKKRAEELSKKE